MKGIPISAVLALVSAVAIAQPGNPAQIALGLRAQESVAMANERQAAHYAENRQRCEVALRIAKLCGKYAGKFYCDEKGFKEIPAAAVKPIVMDRASTYTMNRCAQDAAKRGHPGSS